MGFMFGGYPVGAPVLIGGGPPVICDGGVRFWPVMGLVRPMGWP